MSCCHPLDLAPNFLPTSAAGTERGQWQILLRRPQQRWLAPACKAREESLGQAGRRRHETSHKTWFICSKLWAWQCEEQQALAGFSGAISRRSSVQTREGPLASTLQKAERSTQDGPFPEPLEDRLNAKSCGQIREMIWGKPQRECNSIKIGAEICTSLQVHAGKQQNRGGTQPKKGSWGYGRWEMKWKSPVTCSPDQHKLKVSLQEKVMLQLFYFVRA